MIIKRAYHRIQTVEGQMIEGPLVVEQNEGGTFVSYHLLRQEEAATEWVGGTFLIQNS